MRLTIIFIFVIARELDLIVKELRGKKVGKPGNGPSEAGNGPSEAGNGAMSTAVQATTPCCVTLQQSSRLN